MPLSGRFAVVAGGPRGAGRGIVLDRSGQVLTSWDLARAYGTDVDGAQPDWAAHYREHVAPVGAAAEASA